MNIEIMEEKYINLLLNRCLNFDNSKSLLIYYNTVNKNFVDKVIEHAKKIGVIDIYLDEYNIYEYRDKINNLSLEEIEKDKYFDKSIWDSYAKKGASFLMFESEFPGVMDDVDQEKLSKARFISRNSRKLYRDKSARNEIPWCIAALPNKLWADSIFKNDENSYEKLYEVILKMCMIDTDNPIDSWNNYIKKATKRANKLTSMGIKKIHYTNSLGTDLYISYPEGSIWECVGSESENNMIANMPSYEVFTSPDYRKTEGIVYNSKPLMYGGGLVDKFYIKFENGKAVDYKAEIGNEILKNIITSDDTSCYLGETALVNYDSPISNTGLVFGTTLFDENASCHIALGNSFPTCIKDGTKMSKEELIKKGLNYSSNHVDFMIGTNDLRIEAETKDGNIVLFKDGNFPF